MKMKMLIPLFFFVTVLSACSEAQDGKTVRLLVRGDDMGMARSVNLACIEAYKNGFMKSVEVMVPTPWFPDAAALLKENPGLDVGIHLTFTSEWDRLKWKPLTQAPSLTDSLGYFFPMIWPNNNYGPDRALKAQAWKIAEIEAEARAQIETGLKALPNVTHLSYHMGCNQLDPEVKALFKKLAVEYGLDIDLEELGVKGVSYVGAKKTPAEKIAGFKAMLENLGPGTWLFIDHPAYDDTEMRGTGHTGYEDVALDRQGVTELFTDQETAATAKQLGILFVSYAELKK